jgi:ribosomal protein S18 acetylase RimI-like enzyme
MRFLLDSNVLIPLEDSNIPQPLGLANFVRLAREYGHLLVYHPASEEDINRDKNTERRIRTKNRLAQYTRLDGISECPWNTFETSPNDACDNAILFSLLCDAAHYLITEDRKIHKKAVSHKLGNRVFGIKAAEDFLQRFYEPNSVVLPNIEDVPLHSLTQQLNHEFFDSLRIDYKFDEWFREKAKDGRRAWIYSTNEKTLGALCIYARQENIDITGHGDILHGGSLKLCTFKVAEEYRGRKIGELFLKAAFRYATKYGLENIFIHGSSDKQPILFELLSDFGFSKVGEYGSDVVYVKKHPALAPVDDDQNLTAFEYSRTYFPHFKQSASIKKFIIPIRPEFHRVLFPDYDSVQGLLFNSANTAGNAIKQAYLCYAMTSEMSPGDIVLFYRSTDEMSLTSIGIVERYETLNDVTEIANRVGRRTVYSMTEITKIAAQPTKVLLFRLVKHFPHPLSYSWLSDNQVVNGHIQSIQEINDNAYQKIISQAA